MNRFFYTLFKEKIGITHEVSTYLNVISNLLIIAILGYLLFKVIRYYGSKFIKKVANKTKTEFDNILIENKFFLNISRVFIFLITYASLQHILIDFPDFLKYAQRFTNLLIVVSFIWLVKSILQSIKDFLRTFSAFKDKPLESYVQIFMILLWIIGFVVSFSIITGKPLLRFFTALGAFSAVLLLIFKDTILGFVASIQISVYDTVRLQDWITMEKYGADGNVTEINLTSVIVKNFDNTITSIPTYSLISESFKNWRAMSHSGGRRIKRAINIKINSIQFLDEKAIEHFKKIELLNSYVNEISEEVNHYNTTNNVDKSLLINGRNLTNFGMFRKYLDLYLDQHPKINKDLLFMSRQLAPTENGVPLEIYAFSSEKQWLIYERVMADIFDHIFASVPYFNLEVFENPSSKDIMNLK
ncbi:mechanosensitive ion channel family protein [Tenacibaculum sp. M341]|uniref:mechanosensitive ion channel family protein n=1 Tax=Tenacibaculum sp. M341 TaxID=2530339 RepID=UPI001044EE2E|nr:mechanosensitive ion channel domain-containing protein [Tenacibaculum sp. M341]TCI84476.1 mechanosensitive ion channel [Tenacibaculum sp. M341]